MAHTCHAIACEKRVPARMFMCRGHWFQLPSLFRRNIWTHFNPEQLVDWNPTEEYCRVAKQCIIYIATQEGRTPTGKERELVLYDWLNGAPVNIHSGAPLSDELDMK